jgi:hypothetical protein
VLGTACTYHSDTHTLRSPGAGERHHDGAFALTVAAAAMVLGEPPPAARRRLAPPLPLALWCATAAWLPSLVHAPSPAVCRGDVPGWVDSHGTDGCASYAQNNWCCDPDDTTECDSDGFAPTAGPYRGQGPTSACCASCTVRGLMCNEASTGGNSTAYTLAGVLEYNSSAHLAGTSCSVLIQAPQPGQRVRVAFESVILQPGFRVEFFNSVAAAAEADSSAELMLRLRPQASWRCWGSDCVEPLLAATGRAAARRTGTWCVKTAVVDAPCSPFTSDCQHFGPHGASITTVSGRPVYDSADSTVLVRLVTPLTLLAPASGGGSGGVSRFRLRYTFERGTCSDGAATVGESGGADCGGACGPCVPGCTEPSAANYAAAATRDDGSCTFGTAAAAAACTDSSADNYNPAALRAYPGACRYHPRVIVITISTLDWLRFTLIYLR